MLGHHHCSHVAKFEKGNSLVERRPAGACPPSHLDHRPTGDDEPKDPRRKARSLSIYPPQIPSQEGRRVRLPVAARQRVSPPFLLQPPSARPGDPFNNKLDPKIPTQYRVVPMMIPQSLILVWLLHGARC